MEVKIDPSWKTHLNDQFEQLYFISLTDFVKKEYKTTTVYPPAKFIFRAFDLTPFDKVKVVILGQDPYINQGEAMGLSFSVPDGTRLPPSLQNIYKEIESEFGQKMVHTGGDLTRWAEQGVLLLNASLTVRAHLSNSHQGKGWEQFTDAAIRALSSEREHIVFMLWGNYAKAKGAHIDRSKHLVLESAHPSPFSANHGFFGNGHFKKANEYLEANGEKPIDWL
ncbi:MAG TPA: uracil-DNA glycosylase [Candidatus Paceibacterota bacterium]|nr:uracil-DNA glycosylase [Candidatus Paceibacterota bacterium]